MNQCSYTPCQKRPSFNYEGNKTARYCKQHAETGMVDVSTRRCVHDSCTNRSNFNVFGIKRPLYCKQHADAGMINVQVRRCSQGACMRQPNFNTEGSKTGRYCKQHAESGMVNVRSRRCSHDSCMVRSGFNVAGINKPAYCKQHAHDGMVPVAYRRCSHDTCTKRASFGDIGTKEAVFCPKYPNFNIARNKKPSYCKQHAADGMINVRSKRCSHDACSRMPLWGVLSAGAGSVCSDHLGDLPAGQVINFKAKCKVVGCSKLCRWGVAGKQPTHCPEHAQLEIGLVRTVGVESIKKNSLGSPGGAGRGGSCHVKTECML